MGKRIKKLTRQQKQALALLDDEFRTSVEVGVPEGTLNALADHSLVRSILDVGEMRYRLTSLGQERLTEFRHRESA